MARIIIHNIKDKPAQLWRTDKDGKEEYEGWIDNYLQFLDIRLQIKKAAVDNFFIYFDKQKINILPNGKLSSYPNGLFDLAAQYLVSLVNTK